MVERGHQERFDRVIQILIIIEAALLEYAWTTENSDIFLIVMFISALTLWALAELRGGRHEYLFKTISFDVMVFFILYLFSHSFFSDAVPIVLQLITIGITFPLISLCCSMGVAFYLGELNERSFLMLISITVIVSSGFFLGVLIGSAL